MEITYYVAEGDPITIEVDEEWGELVVELDHENHKNDRRAKSHKVSLEAYDGKGTRLASKSNILEDLVKGENVKYLYEAIDLLEEKHRVVIIEAFINGRSYTDIADTLGISRPAVSQRASTALKKLKKLLEGKIIL